MHHRIKRCGDKLPRIKFRHVRVCLLLQPNMVAVSVTRKNILYSHDNLAVQTTTSIDGPVRISVHEFSLLRFLFMRYVLNFNTIHANFLIANHLVTYPYSLYRITTTLKVAYYKDTTSCVVLLSRPTNLRLWC